ncbi:MAG TPA: hypothetical protein VF172_08780 [Nitrososphaera sp.]
MKTGPGIVVAKELLLTAIFSVAAAGPTITLGQSYVASAQEMTTNTTANNNATGNADANNTNNTIANATGSTATAASNKLAGIIASLQIQESIAPEWITAGYWEIESDGPLFGGSNQSEPTITRFDAIVEMTRITNGTMSHEHTFSNFRQSDIVFTPGNSTTINGTMTVITEDGPTEDVPAYITLHNNLISIFVNPGAINNHFGPTPIYGMILSPERLQTISDRLSPTAGEGIDAAMQQNSTSAAPSTTGNVTG